MIRTMTMTFDEALAVAIDSRRDHLTRASALLLTIRMGIELMNAGGGK